MEKTIDLIEALTGFEFYVNHLDERYEPKMFFRCCKSKLLLFAVRQLLVKNEPGSIISPNDLRSITGEGMPMKGNPFHKGNLYILFTIKFPVAGTIKPAQAAVRYFEK